MASLPSLHTLNNNGSDLFCFVFGLQSKIYSETLAFISIVDFVFLELAFSTLK